MSVAERKVSRSKVFHSTVVLGSLFGALLYGVLLGCAEFRTSAPFIGDWVYNYYFLSLLKGDLSVPVQIIGLEGHYDATGRAMVYHGLAPLVTRAIAAPFVDLTAVDLRAPTIWFFATLGSASFYALALSMLGPLKSRRVVIAVWTLVWVLGGGAILVMNGSFFHEPIAVAFAMLGAGLLCLYHFATGGFRHMGLLVAMAFLAAIAVHARPHVAVGLYAGVLAAAVAAAYISRMRSAVPILISLAILGAGGLLYLAINQLRFGDFTRVDAGVSSASEIVYGFVYWGIEAEESLRRQATEEFGRFNIGRLLPNVLFYHFAFDNLWTQAEYNEVTAHVGHIRVEYPYAGLLYLWLPWLYLSALAILRRRIGGLPVWLMLITVLPTIVMVYSYPTVTMRYRVELWAPYFILGMAGLRWMLAHDVWNSEGASPRVTVLVGMGVISVFCAGYAFYTYSDYLNWSWGTMLRSYEDCATFVSAHPGLGPDRVEGICVIGGPDHGA